MKLTSSALGAVGASVLLATGAGAIDVDVTSTDSIKNAAKLAAAGMTKWYTGYRPGDVAGNLPDPYYWWECGAMFNGLIDYWYYTGDSQYNNITAQGLEHQIGDYNAFMPQNQSKSLGNDDQAFWGMAAMSAAENKLPDLGDDQPSWLGLAQAVFNTQAERWNDKKCGGGLNWQIYSFNKGFNYRNTISNGCFFNIAARLYKYTKNETYMDWAEKVWDWELSVKLFDLQDGGYHFYDGADENINCTEVNHIQWTYNAGVHLAGAAAMFNATSSDEWKTRLSTVIKGLDVFFKDGVMYEVACETGGTCNTDQRSFKAYLSRNMGYSMVTAPFTQDLLKEKLTTSAAAGAKQCTTSGDEATCGLKWTNNGQNDGSVGVGENMAVMEALQNLLFASVSGPVTEAAGGISKADPNAGAGATTTTVVFDEVTAGDKAGAGILTTIVLVAIVAGAWWMVA
ncbi:mannan endo-1,6-alpha-mannosidase DCW1 precursor [Massarina eburnea CBS 473.64]|uniref:Mannan endo-1,6-alpha-mannosidase n=1 Tax=Massarina eburnea CBS 473.64 TaxID=1395130 RepID=A0A6A6RIT5_9PLEO|nr:mannan endo-1,6-alpha-mannosidase DCW1 precursor [Massarina eburnea CBS 473.64]